jgi:hypothetical protein
MMAKRNLRTMMPMDSCCCEGCDCTACKDKKLSGGTGVDSGLSSRESINANAGTVKSWELVDGEEYRPDKTGNDISGVF